MKHRIRIMAIVILVVVITGGIFALSGQAKTFTAADEAGQMTLPLHSLEPISQSEGRAIHLEIPNEAERQVQSADETQRTVSVSGSGQVQAQPDQAIVRLGVQTQAEAAEQALSENNTKMQALLDTLKQAGIPAEDIQTQALRLHPLYEEQPIQQGANQTVRGYMAANTVEVRARNLANLGELLDAAVEAGGNTIEGVSFEVSDSAELLDQARAAAMQDALRKAEQLASLADASLGSVLTINEFGGFPRPVARGEMALEAAAVPIEPGTHSISVEVQVTWLLQ